MTKINYVTVSEALLIHATLLKKFGGTSGSVDLGLLESALFRPQTGYYPDLISEAAALFESLLMNHPFVDGNKRVAFAVTDVFLRLNGHRLKTYSREAYPVIIEFLKNTSLQTKDIDQLLLSIGGAPCVIKLLEGTQGIGVILAENSKAAKSVIEAFYELEANMLVQEFIKEARGADIRAFVVDGQIVGAMKRQAKEGEFRSNLHRGGSAQVIQLSAEERATALKAVKKLGLGIAGVDMLQSDRGPLVMEVNSSPGLEGIEGATGEDIAGKIIEYVERNEFNDNES